MSPACFNVLKIFPNTAHSHLVNSWEFKPKAEIFGRRLNDQKAPRNLFCIKTSDFRYVMFPFTHELIYVVSTPEFHQWLNKSDNSVSRNLLHLRKAGVSTYLETVTELEQLSCDSSCTKWWENSVWYIHSKNISIFFYILLFPSTSCHIINQSIRNCWLY